MSLHPPPVPDWAAQPPPPAMPPPPTGRPVGWYPDPGGEAAWRWWDGRQWTAHLHPYERSQPTGQSDVTSVVATTPVRKPRLPSWLSVPVLIGGIPGIALIVVAGILVPLSILLGLVPLLVVAPVLLWMDRVEPEPWSARLHAFLWGAFVAGGVSLVVNSVVAIVAGETVAAVASAPVIEEITKGLAIVWAVRRHQVDSIMDGLVYAGWAGLGFAVVEDFSYFVAADGEDLLLETFIGRALLTPFAHPLFTAWTGLAIGLAVRNRRRLATAWWGLLLAIGTHALWNGSLTLAETEGGMIVAAVTILFFILLFLATAVGVMLLRRRDRKRFAELMPFLAHRYGVPPDRAHAHIDRGARRATRRRLDRPDRRAFDHEAAALARLAALFDHPEPPGHAEEARLVALLAASGEATTA